MFSHRDKWWSFDGRILTSHEFWSGQRSASTPTPNQEANMKSIDIRELPDLLKEFGEMIKAMTQSVNEEIQVVIGSVQIEDAKVMRRQTEWTVVLAILAAIYLPMTLVTGILGMEHYGDW